MKSYQYKKPYDLMTHLESLMGFILVRWHLYTEISNPGPAHQGHWDVSVDPPSSDVSDKDIKIKLSTLSDTTDQGSLSHNAFTLGLYCVE